MITEKQLIDNIRNVKDSVVKLYLAKDLDWVEEGDIYYDSIYNKFEKGNYTDCIEYQIGLVEGMKHILEEYS